MFTKRDAVLDRIKGMLVGHNLGDVLGAPYEYGNTVSNPIPYHGRVEYPFIVRTQWQGVKDYGIGTVTDDSSMTWALIEGMRGGFSQGSPKLSQVLDFYLEWGSRWNKGMGRNTRALLKHTTINKRKSYETQYRNLFGSAIPSIAYEGQIGYDNQSNGSLMRCCPLAVYPTLQPFIDDCIMTKPSAVNVDCSLLYGLALWLAIRGVSREKIWIAVQDKAQTRELQFVIDQIKTGTVRDCKPNKAHVLNALYYALLQLVSESRYREVVDHIAPRSGEDTDTNAAIAGALAGALEGFKKMMSDTITKANYSIMVISNDKIDYDNLIEKMISS